MSDLNSSSDLDISIGDIFAQNDSLSSNSSKKLGYVDDNKSEDIFLQSNTDESDNDNDDIDLILTKPKNKTLKSENKKLSESIDVPEEISNEKVESDSEDKFYIDIPKLSKKTTLNEEESDIEEDDKVTKSVEDEIKLETDEIKENIFSENESEEESEDNSSDNEKVFEKEMNSFKKKYKYNNKDKEWVQTEKEKELTKLLFGGHDSILENLEKSNKELINEKKQIKREAKWFDPDDEVIDENTKNKRRKKEILEKKYENIITQPTWANIDQEDDNSSDDEILRTVGHVKSTGTSKTLPKSLIQYKKLKDLNQSSHKEGPTVKSIEFHPTSTVALVAGLRGCVSLFAVDGDKNEKLHTMLIKKMLINNAKFNKSGSEIVIGGSLKNFTTFDLLSGVTDQIPLPKVMTKCGNFEISPDEKYLICAGRFGELHLFDANVKEKIYSYKQENNISSMSFNPASNQIFTHSDTNEITIFDIRSSKIFHKFYDDGCLHGTGITISPNRQLIATSSGEGVVNVYNYDDCIKQKHPTPLKCVLNLTTSIYSIKFNPSSEILGFCSRETENAVRLLHLPSCTVFSNFPNKISNIGSANVVNFSPGSKYFVVGNVKACAKMYSLKHFVNY